MPRPRPRPFLLTLTLLTLITLVGCGAKPIPVKGKVVLPQNVTLAQDDSAELRFVNEDPKGKSAATTLSNSDASFAANVIPGKYKIVLRITPYPGKPTSKQREQGLEPVNNAFSEKNSKVIGDVSDKSDQSVTIDLVKGTVSSN